MKNWAYAIGGLLSISASTTLFSGESAYITNAASGTVTVVDLATSTVFATVTVGTTPTDIITTPNGNELYVTNAGSNSVSVINPLTNSVIATVAVGTSPEVVVATSDSSKVFVLNTGSNNVSVIDTASHTVIATIAIVGINLQTMDITPDSTKVYVAHENTSPNTTGAYVTNYTSNSVSVINISTNVVTATITVGNGPLMEWATPDLSRVYVYNGVSGTVSVINTSTELVVATITVGTTTGASFGTPPNPISNGGVYEQGAMSSDGLKLIIANGDTSNLSIIDTNPLSLSFNKVIATVTPQALGNPSLWTTGITPANSLAYVGDFKFNDVYVLDLSTNAVIATITLGVGSLPPGAAVLPNGLFAYAPEANASTIVDVIDTTTQAVIASITCGNDTGYLSINPLGTRVYVSNLVDQTMSVIDTGSNSVIATITFTGTPNYSIVNAAGTRAYVSLGAGFQGVDVIDTSSNTIIATITIGGFFQFIGFTPDQSHLYVPKESTGQAIVIDTSTNSIVATVTVGITPYFVVFSDAHQGNTGIVSVINTTSLSVVATAGVGIQPEALAITPNSLEVYVGDSGSAQVSVISTVSELVIATITVGTGPFIGEVVTPNGVEVYVANGGSNNVSVINTATHLVVATVTVGANPALDTVSLDGSLVYVANGSSNNVSVISTASHTVIATVAVGAAPKDVALTPDGTELYVLNLASARASVINTGTNTVVANVPTGGAPDFVAFAFSPSFAPAAPTSLTGRQSADNFFDQIDLVNTIRWIGSTGTPAAVQYNIYRNAALTDFAGSVSASDELKFKDHNRRKGVTYTYYIVAVSSTGLTSTAAVISVRPLKHLSRTR